MRDISSRIESGSGQKTPETSAPDDAPEPEIVPAFQSRVVRLLTLLFIVSIIFAFWLISYDEMIKAFIGILIINGWFFTILILHLQGKILFLDDIEKMEKEKKDGTQINSGCQTESKEA